MKCPNCNADNPDGSIFCGDCGAPLAGSAPEPEAPTLPVAAQALARCPDCGANPIAEVHYEATMEPKDAQGPILYEDRPVNKRGELKMPDLDDILDAFLGPFLDRQDR